MSVLDDYGVSTDEHAQRNLAYVAASYVLGISDELLTHRHRHYGVAFEVPLFAIDRIFGLNDPRHIHLLRHFLTHAFFLTGGMFCYLLALRLFGSRLLAAFALLVFVLHPRLYAHSFFNSKDIPFLVAFMAALFLIHRAFRLGTIGAFAVCGAAVGLLGAIRPPGLMLLFAVPPLCAIETAVRGMPASRGGRDGRWNEFLLAMGAFLGAGLLALLATWPYLWGDPLGRVVESIARFAQFNHGYGESELFRGTYFRARRLPDSYLPTWVAITTPPATLLLGLVGAGAVAWRSLRRPREALCDANLRFGALLLASFVLPAAAVVTLGATPYNGWRHLYFLHAPLAVLAIFGLHWLASHGGRASRVAACGLLAGGLVATVVEMAVIHPHQNVYFNALVDRSTPLHLRSRYNMDYWRTSTREALEHLMEGVPTGPVYISPEPHGHLPRNLSILPRRDRERVVLGRERASYHIVHNPMDLLYHPGWSIGLFPPTIWERRVYGSPIVSVAALDLSEVDAATVGRYRETYRRAVAGEPLIEAEYDVYLDADKRRLFYAKQPCDAEAVADPFVLDVTPASATDLPDGFQALAFTPTHPFHAVFFDDKCLASVRLPPYPIAHFGTGQYAGLSFASRRVAWARGYALGTTDDDGAGASWRAWTDYWRGGTEWRDWVNDHAPIDPFDVVVSQGRLLYQKPECTLGEQHARFFLDVWPRRSEDLPRHRRPIGFDKLDFDLDAHGGRRMHSGCFASVPLPDYDIKTIYTGQRTARRGTVWEVEIASKGLDGA